MEPTIHWRLDLPESLEAFLRSLSKGARTPLRRHANRFERDFAGQFELSFVGDPSDLETFVSDVVAVAEKTYQRQLGVAFEDTPFNRRVVQLTMERGQFRGYVLYVSGKPIAFWQGHAYGGVFYTTFTGFDPAYADYRVGTYLLMKAIDDLCGNSDVTAIDYGLGAAEWKERYGSESWYEADLILYSPGPRTLWINAARALTLTANRSAKRVASRTGAARRLKRGWRRRMAQS